MIHAMDAFAGAIGVSDSAGKGTPVYSVCTPIGEANPLYYAHALREMSRNKWIESLAKGIRERSSDFRFTEFSGQVVPCPTAMKNKPPSSATLDNADQQIQRYIASKERLITLLEEERQALVHQAVTRGLDPNVRLKSSGVEWLGDVPEHWDVGRLKTHVANINDSTRERKGNEKPYIALEHVESWTGKIHDARRRDQFRQPSPKVCKLEPMFFSAETEALPSPRYPRLPGNQVEQREYAWENLLVKDSECNQSKMASDSPRLRH